MNVAHLEKVRWHLQVDVRKGFHFFKTFKIVAFAITEFDSQEKQETYHVAEHCEPALWPTQWVTVAHSPRIAVQMHKKDMQLT